MTSSPDWQGTARLRRRCAPVLAAVAIAVLAGCGGSRDKGGSQTAAKVNRDEITVHQINFVLQQQRGLKPEQTDAAARQVLERLIDQELALQKAEEMKLDREPRVVQQIEAARREIIARQYVEKASEGAAKPTPEQVKAYYDAKPALFSARRVYNLQELAIEAKPEQVDALRAQLQSVKDVNAFVDYLKANSYRFSGNQAVRPAEQLPLNMLDTFAKMRDGQALLVPSANGAQVIVLASSRSEPVDEARAKPAIEQFLWNDAKKKLVEADMKALRTSAKIDYVGKFAEGAASAADAASAAVITPSPVEPLAPASAAGSDAGSAPPIGNSTGLDASSISKGMGLK